MRRQLHWGASRAADLCHVQVIVEGDEAGPSEIAAGIVALPPHVHPLICLEPLPGNARECMFPQPLQPLLHIPQCTCIP